MPTRGKGKISIPRVAKQLTQLLLSRARRPDRKSTVGEMKNSDWDNGI